MAPKRTLVVGSNGQLGRAVRAYAEAHELEGFEYVDADTFDIADPTVYEKYDWDLYGTIINAAAYTAVDRAETSEGRKAAWNTNVRGAALLSQVARDHKITVVHISSDYVFDGTQEMHTEEESFAPLGVYGQTKAAADELIATAPKYYILRSSWIVGEGRNFVTRMFDLAQHALAEGKTTAQAPVDQFGRLTFADDLTRGIFHLLDTQAPFGTYNLTGEGATASWHDIATSIFEQVGADSSLIEKNSVEEYAKASGGAMRPRNCALDLAKIKSVGFTPREWSEQLKAYIAKLSNEDK